jgi:hypothetical protein
MPEMLLLALAPLSKAAGGRLRMELLSRLLPLYFRPSGHPVPAQLIRRLWQLNNSLVLVACVDAFMMDSNSLQNMLYLNRIIGLIPELTKAALASSNVSFAISMACMVAGTEISNARSTGNAGSSGNGGITNNANGGDGVGGGESDESSTGGSTPQSNYSGGGDFDVEAWVSQRLQRADRDAFCRALLTFIHAHLQQSKPKAVAQQIVPVR